MRAKEKAALLDGYISFYLLWDCVELLAYELPRFLCGSLFTFRTLLDAVPKYVTLG
jgi:hypothetical protein